METFTVYILYSSTIDRFYIGYTSMSLPERLGKHNTNHKGFTGQTNDWAIRWAEPFDDKTQAIRKEKQIKRRGAKRFLESLKR